MYKDSSPGSDTGGVTAAARAHRYVGNWNFTGKHKVGCTRFSQEKSKLSKEKEKNTEKPEEHPGITLASLFLQPNACTGVWMYGGHTHCYPLLPLCLKDRQNLQPPATLSWKKHQEKREVPFTGTEPPAPATDKGGPQGEAKGGHAASLCVAERHWPSIAAGKSWAGQTHPFPGAIWGCHRLAKAGEIMGQTLISPLPFPGGKA